MGVAEIATTVLATALACDAQLLEPVGGAHALGCEREPTAGPGSMTFGLGFSCVRPGFTIVRMRTSTKQAITFLGLGIAVLLGCIILAQRGRIRPVDYTARKAHIQARQIVPSKGMETILAGPMIRGEDAEQIEKKKGKTTIPLGTVSTDSVPSRMIFLDSFLLDTTEVTNKAYRHAVEAGLVTPPSGKASGTRED